MEILCLSQPEGVWIVKLTTMTPMMVKTETSY
jgi:hypothetical protein